jgi:hypothetical protein
VGGVNNRGTDHAEGSNMQPLAGNARHGMQNMQRHVVCSLLQLMFWLLTSRILREHLQRTEFYCIFILSSYMLFDEFLTASQVV